MPDRRVDYCPCWKSALSGCPSSDRRGEKYLQPVTSERENMAVAPAASSQSTRSAHNATWLNLIAAERFEPNDTEAYHKKGPAHGCGAALRSGRKGSKDSGLFWPSRNVCLFTLSSYTLQHFHLTHWTLVGKSFLFFEHWNVRTTRAHARTHTPLVVPTSSFNFCFSNAEEETVKRDKWKKMLTTVWPQINYER